MRKVDTAGQCYHGQKMTVGGEDGHDGLGWDTNIHKQYYNLLYVFAKIKVIE